MKRLRASTKKDVKKPKNGVNMAGSKEVIDLLRSTDIFSDIEGEALRKLAEESRISNLTPRQGIFAEGFQGTCFYILLEGTVRIFKTSPDGSESTIKIIRAGEFFGEVILFGSDTYPVSATSISYARLLGISRASFFSMLASSDARDRFIAALFRKLRYLSDQVHFLTSLDVEERFFRFLRDHYGENNLYHIELPKTEIAAAIGTMPETFSRLIARLTTRGILSWEGSELHIKTSHIP